MGNGFFAKIFGKSKDNQENKMEQVEQPGKIRRSGKSYIIRTFPSR